MIHGEVIDEREVGMAKQLVCSPARLGGWIRRRTRDYPAFRQNRQIIDYSCWRVTESVQGQEPFTHLENIKRWTRDWSQHGPGHASQADNLKISSCYWG
jgi:hypothetical protein